MAYGYEVAVTPLQIAAAYGVVANGGVLYKPTIVKRVAAGDGTVGKPEMVRRVLSTQTAATLTRFLSGVVEKGTGTGARVADVAIAGKTGTARKVVDGKYDQGSYTATFAGFFPADNPKVVCVVMLDTGSKMYSGGQTSAPIFRNIAERVLGLSERFAETDIAETRTPGMITLPDVRNMEAQKASALLGAAGFEVETHSGGILVTGQSPRPGTSLPAGGRVVLETIVPGEPPLKGNVRVPDLRSLSVRRAMNRLAAQHLTMTVRGSGVVVSQSPPAGELVKPGSAITVRCQSRPDMAARLN